MALDPLDQKIMTDAFYDALKAWSKGGGGFNASGGGTSSSWGATPNTTTNTKPNTQSQQSIDILGFVAPVAKRVGVELGALGGAGVDLAQKLISGGVKVSDATSVLTDAFKDAGRSGSVLGKVLGPAGELLGGMFKYVEEGVDVFRDLSKSGANFSNDVIELRNNAANARLSLSDFQDVVKNNTKSFAGLGGTVGGGAKVFSEFSKSFFDSRAADNLRLLGYTSKDVNEMMATQLAGMTKRELIETGGQQAAMDRLERMGKEMDAVSKLTGQRRDELDKELRKNREDAQRRAAIELMILNGGKNARDAMDASSIAFQKAGPTFAKAATDMVTAGRPLTDEARDAVGTMSGEVQAELAKVKQATEEGRTADAKDAANRAAALFAAQNINKTTLGLAAQGQETFKAKIESLDFGKRLQEAAEEFKKAGMSETEAIIAANKKLGDQVKKDQDAEGEATKTTILLENRLGDASAALNNSLILPLNGAVKEGLGKFAQTLQDIQGPDPKYKREGYLNKAESYPTGARGKAEGMPGELLKGIVDGAIGPSYGKNTPEPTQFKDENLKTENQKILEAISKGVKEKDVLFAREIVGALKANEKEAVTAKISELAKQQNKSADVLIREYADKGELKKLRDTLKDDPKTKATMDMAEKSRKAKDENDAWQAAWGPSGRETGIGRDKNPLAPGIDWLQGLFTKSNPGIVELSNGEAPPAPRRDSGSLEMAGKMFEDWGKGTMVELHGLESVMRPQDLSEVIEAAMSGVRKTMPKIDVAGGMKNKLSGFDFGKLIDSSKVSVSGGGSSTVKIPADEMAEMMKPFKGSFDKLNVDFKGSFEKFNVDFDEFGTNFDDVIAKMSHDVLETIGDPKALSAQDKIDEAIAAKEAAYDKLQRLWNEGSDEELNENHEKYAEELRIAKENLSRVVDESIGDLVGTFDSSSENWESSLEQIAKDIDTEFGDLAGAMKRAAEDMYPDTEFGDLDSAMEYAANQPNTSNTEELPKIDLNSLNLPGFGTQIRSSAATIPQEVNRPKPGSEENVFDPTGNKGAPKSKTADKTDSKTDSTDAKATKATLDDVVKKLESLNSSMNRMIEGQAEIGRKQINATRSNNTNIYERS